MGSGHCPSNLDPCKGKGVFAPPPITAAQWARGTGSLGGPRMGCFARFQGRALVHGPIDTSCGSGLPRDCWNLTRKGALGSSEPPIPEGPVPLAEDNCCLGWIVTCGIVTPEEATAPGPSESRADPWGGWGAVGHGPPASASWESWNPVPLKLPGGLSCHKVARESSVFISARRGKGYGRHV